MKFALLEMKQILVRVLLKFDINSCDSTPKSLEFLDDFVLRKPITEIYVSFSKRKFEG